MDGEEDGDENRYSYLAQHTRSVHIVMLSPHNHMRLKGSYSHLKRKEKKKDEGEILRNQVTWEQGRWCFRRHLLNSSSEHRPSRSSVPLKSILEALMSAVQDPGSVPTMVHLRN